MVTRAVLEPAVPGREAHEASTHLGFRGGGHAHLIQKDNTPQLCAYLLGLSHISVYSRNTPYCVKH